MLIPTFALVGAMLALLPLHALARDDAYNKDTIRLSDLPQNAPRFEAYKALPYHGPNAEPRLTGNSRNFRTRISRWSKVPPNFAGHFILGTWGCGTDCTQLVLIDAVTGTVFEPAGLTTNVATNVQAELLQSSDLLHEAGSLKFRGDSRLLVVFGSPEEDENRRAFLTTSEAARS